MGYSCWSVGALVALSVWGSTTSAAAQNAESGTAPEAPAGTAPPAAPTPEGSGAAAASPAAPSAEGAAAPVAAAAAAPPAAPAAAPSGGSTTDAPEVTVVVRDGAVFRGQLVEKIPGQHVTVRLSTGEHRRILWPHIARISDRSERATLAPQVRVEFRADDKRATLQKRRGDRSWFNVCVTPCAGSVAATGTYRVGGEGIRKSEPFRLRGRGDSVRVDAETGTKGRTVLGAVMGVGGGIIAYVGAIVFVIGAADGATVEEDGETREMTDDERRNMRTAGGVMFLGGAAAGIVGLVMLVDNDTKVQVSGPSAGQRAALGGASDALSLQLPLGLALTERGLVF